MKTLPKVEEIFFLFLMNWYNFQFFCRCNPDHEKVLAETVNNNVEREGIKATRLCTHKDDVEHINSVQLKKLPGLLFFRHYNFIFSCMVSQTSPVTDKLTVNHSNISHYLGYRCSIISFLKGCIVVARYPLRNEVFKRFNISMMRYENKVVSLI